MMLKADEWLQKVTLTYWLGIHLSRCSGMKCSISERLHQWSKGTQKSMNFGIPMIWWKPSMQPIATFVPSMSWGLTEKIAQHWSIQSTVSFPPNSSLWRNYCTCIWWYEHWKKQQFRWYILSRWQWWAAKFVFPKRTKRSCCHKTAKLLASH